MREARRAEVAGYGSREILRPECCLLTTPNQALTQSTRRLALSSAPWLCAHPPTRALVDATSSRASGTSYIGPEGLRRCRFPLSRMSAGASLPSSRLYRQSLPILARRGAPRVLISKTFPTAPPPPGTFPLAPRRVTRARNRGRADNVPARATRRRGAGRDRHWNDHAADRRGRQLSLHGNPGHGSAGPVSRPPMRRPSLDCQE